MYAYEFKGRLNIYPEGKNTERDARTPNPAKRRFPIFAPKTASSFGAVPGMRQSQGWDVVTIPPP